MKAESFESRLSDESRMTGLCTDCFVPETVEALCARVLEQWEKGEPVTLQGALTGVCGAAVPQGGCIVSTEKLKNILGCRAEGDRCFVTVEPGVSLGQLRQYCARHARELGGKVFLPNPSEESATLGGLFACNGSGTNASLHGSAAQAVSAVKVLLTNGETLELRRGEHVFDESGCNVPLLGRLELPELKNGGAGIVRAGSDLIDVFGGSEGMLGVITALEIALEAPAPVRWGAAFFFSEERKAIGFAEEIPARLSSGPLAGASLAALEFLDELSLALISESKKDAPKLCVLPDFPPDVTCALYLELEGASAQAVEAALGALLEAFLAAGGREENTWAFCGENETEKFALLRHALTEALCAETERLRQGDARRSLVCTDFKVPQLEPAQLIGLHRACLTEHGIKGALFGHLAERRLHCCLLPEDFAEYEKARALVAAFAAQLFEAGYCTAWEGGVGKLNREPFCQFFGQRAAAEAIKRFFDEKGLLNPGNML